METVEFTCRLETVPGDNATIRLFRTNEDQANTKYNDEFLMHLEGEINEETQSKVQEAEFIVVVDRSGSMGGTPWKQVQEALLKMLDLTKNQGNIVTKAIAYNHTATMLALANQESVNKKVIKDIRASGSTNFVAVFKKLSEIFSDKSQDSSKAYFVFLMTDGLDTCNSPLEIMAEKERLQTKIESFGGEVVFHVLGFSEDHDEVFLESLTYLGTSDGTYSFVTPSEGEKALEERLVQLIQSTSSVVGKNINLEIKSKNVEFMGDDFGESRKEVVLPAMMTRSKNTIKVATKKFVRIQEGENPDIEIKVFEKLRGNADGKAAKITKMDKIVLIEKIQIDDHNLMKLRTALNIITANISEAEDEKDKEKMKVWHDLVRKQFGLLAIDEKSASKLMLSKKKAVESGLGVCTEIYDKGNALSERERGLKSVAAMQTYQMSSNQQHNRRQVKKKAAGMNKWVGESRGSRSKQQECATVADYALDDFALEDSE